METTPPLVGAKKCAFEPPYGTVIEPPVIDGFGCATVMKTDPAYVRYGLPHVAQLRHMNWISTVPYQSVGAV